MSSNTYLSFVKIFAYIPTLLKAIFGKRNIRRIQKCDIYCQKLNINNLYDFFKKCLFARIRAAAVFAIPLARHRLSVVPTTLVGAGWPYNKVEFCTFLARKANKAYIFAKIIYFQFLLRTLVSALVWLSHMLGRMLNILLLQNHSRYSLLLQCYSIWNHTFARNLCLSGTLQNLL